MSSSSSTLFCCGLTVDDCIISGTPLLNMVLWCVLRIHNDEDAEVEDSHHGQDGLEHRDKVVGKARGPGVVKIIFLCR